jgi:hypothetical protein
VSLSGVLPGCHAVQQAVQTGGGRGAAADASVPFEPCRKHSMRVSARVPNNAILRHPSLGC